MRTSTLSNKTKMTNYIESNQPREAAVKWTSPLEDPNIFPDIFLDTIKKLESVHDGVLVVGGSIALAAVGLLDRRVHDIDICISVYSSAGPINLALFNENKKMKPPSITITDIMGNHVYRSGGILNNINICCFRVAEEHLAYSEMIIRGRKIKIQNVNHAILAKQTYANNTIKHKVDLEQVYEILHDLF